MRCPMCCSPFEQSGAGRTECDLGRIMLVGTCAELGASGCDLRNFRSLHLVELRVRVPSGHSGILVIAQDSDHCS